MCDRKGGVRLYRLRRGAQAPEARFHLQFQRQGIRSAPIRLDSRIRVGARRVHAGGLEAPAPQAGYQRCTFLPGERHCSERHHAPNSIACLP